MVVFVQMVTSLSFDVVRRLAAGGLFLTWLICCIIVEHWNLVLSSSFSHSFVMFCVMINLRYFAIGLLFVRTSQYCCRNLIYLVLSENSTILLYLNFTLLFMHFSHWLDAILPSSFACVICVCLCFGVIKIVKGSVKCRSCTWLTLPNDCLSFF